MTYDTETDLLSARLKEAQRVRELEAVVAARDMEIAGLMLAIADRDHRIKALMFEISARSKATEAYRQDDVGC